MRFVPDTFGGHIDYADHDDPADSGRNAQLIHERASQFLEEDLSHALYREGLTHPTQIRIDALHYSQTWKAIHREIIRLIHSHQEFTTIELWAILRKPKPVPEPVLVPEIQE